MVYWKMKAYPEAIAAEEEALRMLGRPDASVQQRIERIRAEMDSVRAELDK